MADTKVRCGLANQLAALKRAQLWYAKNNNLPLGHRVNMIGNVDVVLYLLCFTHGPKLEQSMLDAFVEVVDKPDFSQDDFLPLFALAATIDGTSVKALVRSLGMQAMRMK